MGSSEDPKLKKRMSLLGEVSVSVKRCKILGSNGPKKDSFIAPHTDDSIPEKALKGRSISNRVTLKDAGTCAPRGSATVGYPWGKSSVVKFRFKYRSHRKCSPRFCRGCCQAVPCVYSSNRSIGDLQIESIIPRSPSPPSLDELKPENMTREQAIEAVRRQRAQGATTTRVKRERATTLVIDLSDDDDDDDGDEGDEGGVTITSEGPAKKRARPSNDSGVDMIDLTDD